MNTLNKLIVLIFIVVVFTSKGYSQNADPGIGILMSPTSLSKNSTGILSANVGNYGNATIVSNSLRVTLSVGANAEILGIASGSDIRWSQLNLTTGSANTIKLTNTGGGFNSFDIGDILLIVRGNVVSNPDTILGNIVYIAASNSLLCAGCASPPLNVSQGNASNSNDNSQTSLAVTFTALDAVQLGVVTQPTCTTTTGSFTITNYNMAYTYLVNPSSGVLVSGSTITAPTGTYTVTATSGSSVSAPSASVTVNAQPATPATVTLGSVTQPTCATATGSFTITNYNAAFSYTISPSIGANVSGSTITAAAGTYTVTSTSGACTSTASASVTVNSPSQTTTIRSTACNADSSSINLNSLLPIGTPTNGTWTDVDNSRALRGTLFSPSGISVGNYAFEYKINNANCTISVKVDMAINDLCKVLVCGVVKVHGAFSPNGDSQNSTFIIDNIDDTTCYPDNTVEIYNRWGILVFETRNYNNKTKVFDGTSQGRLTIKQSADLPAGVYFYILTYSSLDGTGKVQPNKKDGYLYLSR